ncbi:hypothetical protein KIF59_05740 [Enterobacter cloacae subsp. cloacae]|nr:hypothetical protein [Enterobacter cloacae subsp. cloacae]
MPPCRLSPRHSRRRAASDSAKASEWLKANSVDTVMGKKPDSKGDLKVSDYVVYQWDDKVEKYKEVP